MGTNIYMSEDILRVKEGSGRSLKILVYKSDSG